MAKNELSTLLDQVARLERAVLTLVEHLTSPHREPIDPAQCGVSISGATPSPHRFHFPDMQAEWIAANNPRKAL